MLEDSHFCDCGPHSFKAMGERRVKERYTGQLLVELLSISNLSLHMLAMKDIFLAKVGTTQREPDILSSSST